jgi:hypothetical protein
MKASLGVIFAAVLTTTLLTVFIFWTLHKPFVTGWAMAAIPLAILWGWFYHECRKRKSN